MNVLDRRVPDRPAAGNAIPPDAVRAMFDRIAPMYDAMNTAMTLGLDARWRRRAAAAASLVPGMSAIDVACGSGALTRELARIVGPAGEVTGFDISGAMLRQASRHRAAPIRYELADAASLPAVDASVDAATIAFGLRNVPDYAASLAELVRVTRPGGRVVVLELAAPAGGVARAISATWFERVVPFVGRLAGGGGAYRYLSNSVRAYPPPEAVADLMVAAGLRQVRWRRLWPGLVTLHVGRRS